MFGNLLGDLKGKQKAVQEKLASMQVSADAGNGAVVVEASGTKQILNIAIDESKLDLSDKEQIEDLVLIAVNEAIQKAIQLEQEETASLMQSMLPPGMDGLGDLFG